MAYKTLDHWNNILSQASYIMSLCKPFLSDETITAVKHYLDHGEYEMAVEGLFIDIMQLPEVPESLVSKTCIELAKLVELDKETVFRDDFWDKFSEFCNERLKS